MNRIWILLSVFLCLGCSVFGSPNVPEKPASINWIEDPNEALKVAKKENKLVAVFVYADWCPACTYMDQATFVDPHVVELINERFIASRIDDDKWDLAAIKLSKQRAIPVLAVVRPVGGRIARARIGLLDPARYVIFLEGVLEMYEIENGMFEKFRLFKEEHERKDTD